MSAPDSPALAFSHLGRGTGASREALGVSPLGYAGYAFNRDTFVLRFYWSVMRCIRALACPGGGSATLLMLERIKE